MGSCFSTSGAAAAATTDNLLQKPIHHDCANVVSINGDLHQYSLPITVSQVLHSEPNTTAAAATSSSFFLCNSDCLYFDDYIPALQPHDQLQPTQIYFVLPLPKLNYKLTASDMAALAVKASLALSNNNNNHPTKSSSRNNNRKARISPVLLSESEQHQEDSQPRPNPPLLVKVQQQQQQQQPSHQYYSSNLQKHHEQQSSSSSSSSESIGGVSSWKSSSRKLQRLSSRRPKMSALRSFRIRLTTISEGSVLLFN